MSLACWCLRSADTNFPPTLHFIFFVRTRGGCYFQPVSILQEIEAADESLPLEEKKRLLDFLAARVNGGEQKRQPTDLGKFTGAVRLSKDPLAWQQRVRGEWE